MTLTPEELRAMLPHASDELVALNCQGNLSSCRGSVAGKGQRRTAKVVKDTGTEAAKQAARPRTSRRQSFIRLTVGPLPKACSKNARVHWVKAAKAARDFRVAVGTTALSVSRQWLFDVEIPWPHISVDLLLRKKRLPARIDPDNVFSMFKSGLDGLVDAGIVADDDTKHVTLGAITTEKADTDETVIMIWRR